MKTIELSAAMASAPVQENLKNFAGLDAQNALGLMTPERLAAVAGGLKYDVISFATEDNVMFKLGNFDKSTKAKDLFKIISDHSAGSLDNIAYVSIGSTGNPSEPIERNIICKICNLIGSIDLYYDKDTFNYFFKPKNKWNTTYVQRIDCTSDFSYEKVLYNAEKYIKLEGK